jgi:hypothetical protein
VHGNDPRRSWVSHRSRASSKLGFVHSVNTRVKWGAAALGPQESIARYV